MSGDLHAEYFGNGHANNGNGANGHGKIFQLTKTTDPDTLAVLDARRTMLADQRLTRSMKAFGCEIIDRALNPAFYDVKGVVTVSDTVLAEVFGVSARSIYTWKYRIQDAGHFWLTGKVKKNMWPITTYHLSCLHKQRRDTKTDSDGTYGSPGRGRALPLTATGARRPGQQTLPLPGSRQGPPDVKSAEMLGISGESGSALRLSPEENFGSDPKPASGHARNQLRAAPETSFGPDPKPISGETRNPVRLAPESDCQHIETQNRVVGHREMAINRLGNRPQGGEDEKAAGAAGDKPKLTARQRESENDFLERCRDVLGKKEMDSNGGLWRTIFRQNKKKAWAVVNETASMKTEGRIKQSASQAMMDLWKRYADEERRAAA